MMLTVLGYWGAYPEENEATAGYLLQTDRHTVLLDCGSGILSKLWKYVRHEDLDAVFISHFHHDHTADIGCLLYAGKLAMAFKKRRVPLAIYANYCSARFQELTFGDNSIGIEITPGSKLDLNGLHVSFAPTVHDEYNLAMRFEYEGKALVYTGDMGPATDLNDFCRGADLLLCEASLYADEKGLISGHMTSEETARLANEAGAKSLMMTHFPHIGNVSDMASEAARYYHGKIYLAQTGLTITV
ncbi:MBL fold metallo-hydrolase [Dehalobacter sp. DCM]|uniref:MBL fold metallo-hydrolase n=1 Tax=Dehalobacter sp. DCM TaxID=2907827 RepID=UPI0030820307|nr:MBL fold metallo-hydrolase [Dehalobacter sp. DCM]